MNSIVSVSGTISECTQKLTSNSNAERIFLYQFMEYPAQYSCEYIKAYQQGGNGICSPAKQLHSSFNDNLIGWLDINGAGRDCRDTMDCLNVRVANCRYDFCLPNYGYGGIGKNGDITSDIDVINYKNGCLDSNKIYPTDLPDGAWSGNFVETNVQGYGYYKGNILSLMPSTKFCISGYSYDYKLIEETYSVAMQSYEPAYVCTEYPTEPVKTEQFVDPQFQTLFWPDKHYLQTRYCSPQPLCFDEFYQKFKYFVDAGNLTTSGRCGTLLPNSFFNVQDLQYGEMPRVEEYSSVIAYHKSFMLRDCKAEINEPCYNTTCVEYPNTYCSSPIKYYSYGNMAGVPPDDNTNYLYFDIGCCSVNPLTVRPFNQGSKRGYLLPSGFNTYDIVKPLELSDIGTKSLTWPGKNTFTNEESPYTDHRWFFQWQELHLPLHAYIGTRGRPNNCGPIQDNSCAIDKPQCIEGDAKYINKISQVPECSLHPCDDIKVTQPDQPLYEYNLKLNKTYNTDTITTVQKIYSRKNNMTIADEPGDCGFPQRVRVNQKIVPEQVVDSFNMTVTIGYCIKTPKDC